MATIKIKQIKSKIGAPVDQKRTLACLGLHKISQVVEVEDTPSNLRNLVETKTSESTLLIYWSTDFTLNLLDFNCCHIRFFLINR